MKYISEQVLVIDSENVTGHRAPSTIFKKTLDKNRCTRIYGRLPSSGEAIRGLQQSFLVFNVTTITYCVISNSHLALKGQ